MISKMLIESKIKGEIQMKSKSVIGLILAILLPLIMTVGCVSQSTPTDTSTPTQVAYQQKVEDFIKNSSTYKFDGIPGSIIFIKSVSSVEGASTVPPEDWDFTVEYQTGHPGHGDRTGQMLAQVVTNHRAFIKIESGVITSTACCHIWDIQADKEFTETTSLTPLPIVSENVSWQMDETVVAATITRPDDDDIHPAVVFVAGSGPTDRDWNSPLLPGTNGSAKLLAEELAKNGYVTIRYDKRFAGPNAEKNMPFLEGKLSLESHVDELAGAVDTLLGRPDVNPDKMFVLANSEGTIHAMNYQLTREHKFAGLILEGVPGRTLANVTHAQLEAQMAALPNVKEIMAGYDKLMADFLGGKSFVADPTLPEGINNFIQSLYTPINLPFSKEFFALDPAPLLGKVTAPTLVMIGKKDFQVDYQLDGAPLESATQGHENVSFVYPENANHVIKFEPRPREVLTGVDGLTYNAPDQILDPDSLQIIKNWLLQN